LARKEITDEWIEPSRNPGGKEITDEWIEPRNSKGTKSGFAPMLWLLVVSAVIGGVLIVGIPLASDWSPPDSWISTPRESRSSQAPTSSNTSTSATSRTRSQSAQRSAELNRSIVWAMAKSFVTNYLSAPSTAKFIGSYTSAVTYLGSGRYRVTASVDAQNSFGATIRTPFTCVIVDEGGSWSLESIDI